MKNFFFFVAVTVVWFYTNSSIRDVEEKPIPGKNREQVSSKAQPAEVRKDPKLTEQQRKSLDKIEATIFSNQTITAKGGESE